MLDNVEVHLSCWRKALKNQGLFFDGNFLLSMIGSGNRQCRATLLDIRSEAEVDDIFVNVGTLYNEEIEAGLPIKGGLIPLLEWLRARHVPVAVVTTTERSTAEAILHRTGLRDYFSVTVTEDDVARTKPEPDIYLKAAALLSASPARCVVLEDSPYGVRSALAAGMTPIQIPDISIPTLEVRALGHFIVNSLTDAHRILEQAWSK